MVKKREGKWKAGIERKRKIGKGQRYSFREEDTDLMNGVFKKKWRCVQRPRKRNEYVIKLRGSSRY